MKAARISLQSGPISSPPIPRRSLHRPASARSTTCFEPALSWMLFSTAYRPKRKRRSPALTRSAGVQLNLSFLNLPVPESQIWEQLDDKQRTLVTSVITRIVIKAAMYDNTNTAAEPSNLQPENN